MRNWILPLISLTAFFSLSAAESMARPLSISLNPGVEFACNSIDIQSGEQKAFNTLNFVVSRLALKTDISNYLSLEISAGYHSAQNKSNLAFSQLPFPLYWNRSQFAGYWLGLAIASEPLSLGDFALNLRGEFSISLTREMAWEIRSAQVSGFFKGRNSFTLFSLDMTVQYQGFTGVTIYAGPRLNLLHGKFVASQIIAGTQSLQEIPFRQNHLAGPLGGALIEIGDNLELNIKASLLARNEFSLAVFYTF